MTWRRVSPCLLAIALAAGTLPDIFFRYAGPSASFHGYRVLAADLHVHTFPQSAGTLAPWDVAREAAYQGLDVLAISPHNQTIWGQVGQRFSRRFGGPMVIAGEEIHGPRFHMIALGIQDTISWKLTASQAIDEIHRQGGVAIAAHPAASSWPAYFADGAIDKLDGTEVFQPIAFEGERYARELRDFYTRSHAAAIGSSDYHGLGPLGLCRTFLFVKEVSEQGVLEAIRAKRTLVLDGKQKYGDAEFFEFFPVDSTFRHNPAGRPGLLFAILAMLGLALACRRTIKADGNSNTL